jgi:hypothetical protein
MAYTTPPDVTKQLKNSRKESTELHKRYMVTGNDGCPEMATGQLDSKHTHRMVSGITKIIMVYSNSRPHTNKWAPDSYPTSTFG